MEIRPLSGWTPEERLEVAHFLLDTENGGSGGNLDPELALMMAPQIADSFSTQLESGWGLWLEGRLSLVAYIGLQPVRLFHFAADKRLPLADKARLLNAYLETIGPTWIAVDRLALARMAGNLLEFKLQAHFELDLGMGPRLYYFLHRDLKNTAPPKLVA